MTHFVVTDHMMIYIYNIYIIINYDVIFMHVIRVIVFGMVCCIRQLVTITKLSNEQMNDLLT